KYTKILDVGCGTGQFIYELYDAGFKNALGIDPYLERDIEHVNGSKVYKKGFFEENGKWNVIIFNHVYEHTETPLEILKKATQLLEPNGNLIIRIPNVDSYAFRKYRSHWFGIHAPVHYFLPSINGMKLLVDQAGLQIKKIRGENLLQFWAFSEAYRLGIWDYHPLGLRTFLENNKLKEFGKKPALFCKKDISYWKSLNKHILRYPELCDWLVYYIQPK
ncbi:MAG: class I SAM-dependent methyltransferase, partial [Chlamydiae bacterium]|nr:class I SAM-dependent methyltransferase [Chlamydiota bacterium]